MIAVSDEARKYYPLPESQGGWRSLDDPSRAQGSMRVDRLKLAEARAWNAQFTVPSAVTIIHHGYAIAEWYENGARPDTTFNIHSCSKSFTGTAYGILFGDKQRGIPGPREAGLDSAAFCYIPEGRRPLTDPRKERITLRHLLSMSSGIAGESTGIFGVRTDPGVNQFAAALGYFPVLARDSGAEVWVSQLAAEPGTRWDYSDPAFAHLSLAFRGITGQELSQFMQTRVFDPIGIESLTWDWMGLDDGQIGRHTTPFSGVHVTARELARFGYLMLRNGAWNGQEIVPPWWLQVCTQSSQADNPGYGLTWWVNSRRYLWSGVPDDAFAAMGYNTNLCCIVPSLDLVIVRIGSGPTDSCEVIAAPFLAAVVQSVQAD
jgi:CubicO group peptidase (beta-lactamase class C family)